MQSGETTFVYLLLEFAYTHLSIDERIGEIPTVFIFHFVITGEIPTSLSTICDHFVRNGASQTIFLELIEIVRIIIKWEEVPEEEVRYNPSLKLKNAYSLREVSGALTRRS